MNGSVSDYRVQPGPQVPKVSQGLRENGGFGGKEGTKAPRACKGLGVKLARKVRQAQPVPKGFRARRARGEILVRKVFKEILGHKGNPVHRDIPAHKEKSGQPDPQVRTVPVFLFSALMTAMKI